MKLRFPFILRSTHEAEKDVLCTEFVEQHTRLQHEHNLKIRCLQNSHDAEIGRLKGEAEESQRRISAHIHSTTNAMRERDTALARVKELEEKLAAKSKPGKGKRKRK